MTGGTDATVVTSAGGELGATGTTSETCAKGETGATSARGKTGATSKTIEIDEARLTRQVRQAQ